MTANNKLLVMHIRDIYFTSKSLQYWGPKLYIPNTLNIDLIPVSVDLRLAPSSGTSSVCRAASWHRRHAAPQLPALQMLVPLDGAFVTVS